MAENKLNIEPVLDFLIKNIKKKKTDKSILTFLKFLEIQILNSDFIGDEPTGLGFKDKSRLKGKSYWQGCVSTLRTLYLDNKFDKVDFERILSKILEGLQECIK